MTNPTSAMAPPNSTPSPSRLMRDTQMTAMPVLGTALIKGMGKTMGRLTRRMKTAVSRSECGPVKWRSRGRDILARSEERRVGKECGSGWGKCQDEENEERE